MRLDEKYNTLEEQLTAELITTASIENEISERKWKLKRRFFIFSTVFSIFCFIIFSQLAASNTSVTGILSEDIQQQQLYTVLHTGFPPTTKSRISGLNVEASKAAAIAFKPNPAAANEKKNGFISQQGASTAQYHVDSIDNNEGWWDRLFPQNHVHLSFLQIPVLRTLTSIDNSCSCFFSSERRPVNNTIEASLSICESKKERFWSKQQIPNLDQCVDSVTVRTIVDDDGVDNDEYSYLFSVLEWAPTTAAPVVLRKTKLYWLVVRTTTDEELFEWIYVDERGRKEQGFNEGPYDIVYQNELGWEHKFNDEPIPSVMIRVEEHHQ
ncbi:hypothetical protein BDF20DRAFT_840231 [Mycotypha africana]|uniref:uncharacterized protein n=1 Tax=Mycotypha africana TaxID=64632 RepID=UPI0023001710|nr:uncharacterized protein BDF20DRAFT_840231 [Mycotypha africana]KAI8967378.1 hypothetical protein BDF20DRAFT_840231 [Mycotypha africana]